MNDYTHTPVTQDGLRMYDDLDAVKAIVEAWTLPGNNVEWHYGCKQEVRCMMPLLARAIDRLCDDVYLGNL